MHKIKDKLLQELRRYESQNELSAGSLDVLHKLTDTIKNIDKIEMLEGSSFDGYDTGNSYANRRGNGRRYSRDSSDMGERLRHMLNEASNEHERGALRRCIEVIERDF